MNKLRTGDELFDEAKKQIEEIQAPGELEPRLRMALESVPVRKKKRPPFLLTAAAAIFLLGIVTFQYDALAYYGKKLLGFDELSSGTLNELNERGYGQIIEKDTVLSDGTKLTINGAMADENQFVLYYTMSNDNGLRSDANLSPARITGLFTNSTAESGTSQVNDHGTELKGILSFEPVSPFSNDLTLHFSEQMKKGSIKESALTFPYHPNKALQTSLKKPIRKTLRVDKGHITFRSIKASPTMTIIEGKLDVENFDRADFALGGIELKADGKNVPLTGGGSGTSLFGTSFDIRYDALPETVETLTLVMKTFTGYEPLNRKIPLSEADKPQTLAGEKELSLKNLAKTSRGIELTVATDEDVMLEGVSLTDHQGRSVPLETTVNMHKNGKGMKERTLIFNTTAKAESLFIEGMHYLKTYDERIEIDVK
ncbi:DUF4179 domain-containing protein [Metabacillus sp. cB07]|uniref:DUF4179 domain-containing protein n=1 Tax=Metabacillus sp. cB07 TaxID=2806989 RepID=UPI001F5CF911|nr:DUF4179 domain-containing protein [Metabacillus sp. cB07]